MEDYELQRRRKKTRDEELQKKKERVSSSLRSTALIQEMNVQMNTLFTLSDLKIPGTYRKPSSRMKGHSIMKTLVLGGTIASSAASQPLFVPIKNKGSQVRVPFDPSWVQNNAGTGKKGQIESEEDCISMGVEMPSDLTYPDFMDTFEYTGKEVNTNCSSSRTVSLQEIGKAAQEIVDASSSDVILFRNLSNVICNGQDFSAFFQGCLCEEVDGDDAAAGWKPMEYIPFGNAREKSDGVDLVTPFPPHLPLATHNEMSYNPKPANLIAFYCLQCAQEGGDTLLSKNVDVTRAVSKEIQEFVNDHGGILYKRSYHDEHAGAKQSTWFPSWQTKTGRNEREAAREFFLDMGFEEKNVYFDESGTLHVNNIHSGYIVDEREHREDERKLWFNILQLGMFTCADGTPIPPSMLQRLRYEEWSVAHAIQLQPGDWIVIRNRYVQHGRLPFVNSVDKKRKILTVYTA